MMRMLGRTAALVTPVIAVGSLLAASIAHAGTVPVLPPIAPRTPCREAWEYSPSAVLEVNAPSSSLTLVPRFFVMARQRRVNRLDALS
jgi:hypothetical protein